MLKDLSEIRRIRVRLGLTQTELANRSGVSQSLITKIENDRTTPSYKKGRAILDALEEVLKTEGKALHAKDIHSTDLFSISKDDKIETALKMMEENAISQLPVIEDDIVIGGITERRLIKNFDRLDRNETIHSVMGDPFPVFPLNTDLRLVKEVLRYHPCILTAQKGKIVGIVTKADMLSEI